MRSGTPCVDDVVVHGAQLLADAGLDFAAEPDFGLAWCCWLAHGVRASGLSVSGAALNVYCLASLIFRPAPIATLWSANATCPLQPAQRAG